MLKFLGVYIVKYVKNYLCVYCVFWVEMEKFIVLMIEIFIIILLKWIINTEELCEGWFIK